MSSNQRLRILSLVRAYFTGVGGALVPLRASLVNLMTPRSWLAGLFAVCLARAGLWPGQSQAGGPCSARWDFPSLLVLSLTRIFKTEKTRGGENRVGLETGSETGAGNASTQGFFATARSDGW